jgi:tryptophan synthase alpha chain
MSTINNRLTTLFATGKKNLLNIYYTAGYPKLDDTMTILKALEASGADMVEIGMPFSDPVADGPTIQESNQTALENGMSLKKLVSQLQGFRKEVSVPVMLMGYVNPVIQYGVEKFCKDISEAGVDGLILPDLPFDQYIEEFKPVFEKYNLSMVFLITPQTSEARMRQIDEAATGFIYVVSTFSITGSAGKDIKNSEEYFKRVQSTKLKNPTMIGFNVKDNASYTFAGKYANGAIIGSAFINVLSQSKDLQSDIQKFVKSVKN